MGKGISTYRCLGFKAPPECAEGCEYRTNDIVDLVDDELKNLPTCTFPTPVKLYHCPLRSRKTHSSKRSIIASWLGPTRIVRLMWPWIAWKNK